jgi:metallophosphoesterase superfamily enzyme
LKQKNQKFKTAEMLLCHTWPALQNRQNRGWKVLRPRFATHCLRFSKNFLCAVAALTTIVLPVFGRSLSAVGV